MDPTAEPKFYLIARSLPTVGRETFIEDMVRHTSLTKNEAAAAIDYMFESLPRYIALGHTVTLGELGYFRATLKSEGSENMEEALPEKIIRKRVVFTFGQKFRDLINSMPVQLYPDLWLCELPVIKGIEFLSRKDASGILFASCFIRWIGGFLYHSMFIQDKICPQACFIYSDFSHL